MSLDNGSFLYEPYPIGLVRPVLPADVYAEMVRNWPPSSLFVYKPKLGHKYSLSEVNNSDGYHHYIRSTPIWSEFYRYVKSAAFVQQVLALLRDRQIDLGVQDRRVSTIHRLSGWRDKCHAGVAKLSRLRGTPSLSARVEFSMLPADGGHIKPHTDAPQKLITLVFAILGEGEWNGSWGGGTAMLKTRDPGRSYNFMNHQLDFEETEPLHVFPFEPNQCLIFVKTFNSLHAVYPMTAHHSGVMRKTLTVNIESW
jgi:hypothetical protein